MKLILYTDGASRGNPGPAAIGIVLADSQGNLVLEHGETIGETTNNVAEYRALLYGLERAAEHGARELEIRTDSQLMERQLRGEYKVRDVKLIKLYEQASRALRRFRFTVNHIPRGLNNRADHLANAALDRAARRSTDK